MPGTFIFKPIEAELRDDKGIFTKLDPFCQATIGKSHAKTRACKGGGSHPHWDDAIIVQRNDEAFCDFVVKDGDIFNFRKKVGECRIDLSPIESEGQVTKWYPLFHGDQIEGRVLLEITYSPDELPTQGVILKDEQPKGELPNDM